VHYIDHPLFGLIVTVRPWNPTAAVDAVAPAAPGTVPAGPAAVPAQPGG
jgi:hypothetical protein